MEPVGSSPAIYVRVGSDPLPYASPRQPSLSLAFMASSLVNKLSLAFLLFVASSSLGVHARASQFFMKTTRPEDPNEAPTIPPVVQGLMSGSGHGLYGHGQEQFAPTTTTNYNNNNYYNNNARPNANTFPSSFPDAELTRESYDNNGGDSHDNHFNNANNSPSKFSNEELDSRSYETKEYNNYVGSKQYGMSDTRFLENGRYFYDVNADTNWKYGRYPTRGNPQAGARAGNYGNGVYGNGNAYEYNNAMEYQNNQMNQESREEYVP